MLRVYPRYLAWLGSARQLISAVERRDPDLGRQLRRAAASVALNLAEGQGNEGGTRRQRYLSALGSAREVVACLEVAEGLGFVSKPEAQLAELSQVIAVLVRLAVGRR